MQKKTELVREWIKKATQDFGMAELAIEYQPEFRDSICFHCQQSSEKYLKAFLLYSDIEFKKTHSLNYLLDLVSELVLVPSDIYEFADILEEYGVAIRYPESRNLSADDVQEAINAATELKQFVVRLFENIGFTL